MLSLYLFGSQQVYTQATKFNKEQILVEGCNMAEKKTLNVGEDMIQWANPEN